MGKASEISALWSKIKPQIGELVRLCHEVESHAEDTSEAFRRGYETAKHECVDCPKQAYTDAIRMEGYQKGLSDAWEAARKICLSDYDGGIQPLVVNDIFNVSYYRNAMKDYSASEAIEKIRQYEQEQQFHVGDEIKTQNGFKGFVIRANDKYVYFVNENGEGCVETMMAAKTGRHFPEIAVVLQKMKER